MPIPRGTEGGRSRGGHCGGRGVGRTWSGRLTEAAVRRPLQAWPPGLTAGLPCPRRASPFVQAG